MTPIKHNRPFIFHFRGESNKGGVTVVYVPDKARWGAAVCSKRDNFNRKLGRKIAQGRAECPVDCKYRFLSWSSILAAAGSLQFVEEVMQAARTISNDLARKHKITLTSP